MSEQPHEPVDTPNGQSPFEPSPFEPSRAYPTSAPTPPAAAAPVRPPSMSRPSVRDRVGSLKARAPQLKRPRRTRPAASSTPAPASSPLGPLGLPGWQPPAPAAPTETAPKSSVLARIKGSRLYGPAVTSAVTAVVMVLLHQFVVQPFSVPSGSMQPTLDVGDRFVAEKISYRTGTPHRGDVIVFDGEGSFDAPGLPSQVYVKRVIAVAGDTVTCCDARGRVSVNGSPLGEAYLGEDDHRPFAPVLVPAGHVWVMGDHRLVSGDSRDHGAVPVDHVLGRGVAVVWPLTHAGGLPRG